MDRVVKKNGGLTRLQHSIWI